MSWSTMAENEYEIESLDELVGILRNYTDFRVELPDETGLHRTVGVYEHIESAIDRVAEEVTEKLMPQPFDADGAGVYVGDVMCGWYDDDRMPCTVTMLSYTKDDDDGDCAWYAVSENGQTLAVRCDRLTHYRPLTIEEALRDFAVSYAREIDVPDSWIAKASDGLVNEYTSIIAGIPLP